jgi:PAS domain S-box-containing protein
MIPTPDFAALFRVSPYPYLVMDLELNIIAANAAYLRSTGRAESELLGRYVFDAFPENPDDPGSTNIAEVRSSLLYAIESGEPHTTAFLRYSVPKAGSEGQFEERFWSTVHTPIKDTTGRVTAVAQNAIDVTDLYSFDKQSQMAVVDPSLTPAARSDHFNQARMHQAMMRVLSDERSHLRSLFNQAPGFIAVLAGEQHVFEMVNEAYYQLVGHRPLVGKPVWQALPDIRGQGYEQLLDQVRRTGEPFVGRNMKVELQRVPNGPAVDRFIDVLYQPMMGKDGDVTGIFVQGHDVTDAHTAQLAELESAERLSEGMNAARMVVWDWDIASGAMVYSENAPLVLGLRDAYIDGVSALIHPDDGPRLFAARDAAIRAKGSYQESVRYRRPDDGRMLWLDIRGKVRLDAAGEPVTVRGVTLDVTERMQAEEDLRDAHRRKDEFLAMLAHELRNPLAPISSAAQLLRHGGLDSGRMGDVAGIIVRQVGHITALVDDLIDVSRVTRGLITTEKKPHDMQGIVRDALEQVRPAIQAKGHRLTLELPPHPVHIMGDHKRVVQVLTNLLNNAAKYTPDGGAIALRLSAGRDSLELEVSDNGIGIGPVLLPRVFDLFTQGERSADRAQGGLGVGLAVVRQLAVMHGGRVAVRSQGSGLGSCFELRLPLVNAPELAADEPAPVASSRQSVLLIEDNEDGRDMMAMMLEAQQYIVATAVDGYDGLRQAAAALPDVALVDIGLPGIDGYEVARRMRADPATSGVRLIALTGYGQDSDRARAIEAGFDAHLVKPVDMGRLMEVLEAGLVLP